MPSLGFHGGQFHDARGVPIYEGDLIRTLHFIGRRKKRYWVYHVAVWRDVHMELVPYTDWILSSGGRFWLTEDIDGEVIAGCGPGECLSYEDRRRRT